MKQNKEAHQPEKFPRMRRAYDRFCGFLADYTVVEPLPLDTEQIAEDALNSAQGPNKAVVCLAEAYRKIAQERILGTFSQQFDKSDRKHLRPTNVWSVQIDTQDPESVSSRKTPVNELPNIVIQNEEIDVKRLSIELNSNDEGVSSIIWINRPVGLVNSGEANPDIPPTFGDAFRIDIDAEGNVSFGRESDKRSGFSDVSYTEHNLTGFIEQVQALPELQIQS